MALLTFKNFLHFLAVPRKNNNDHHYIMRSFENVNTDRKIVFFLFGSEYIQLFTKLKKKKKKKKIKEI